MIKFRKFTDKDLEAYRELKLQAYRAASEERAFFSTKAYRFPAYIKQLEEADDSAKRIAAILEAIDREEMKRLITGAV